MAVHRPGVSVAGTVYAEQFGDRSDLSGKSGPREILRAVSPANSSQNQEISV